MSGTNYNYQGYQGYATNTNQSGNTNQQQSASYQYTQPANNYPSTATNNDYCSNRNGVISGSERAAPSTYATDTASQNYNSRSNYNASSAGNPAYSSTTQQTALRSYPSTATSAYSQYNAAPQAQSHPPAYAPLDATTSQAVYSYHQNRPTSTASTAVQPIVPPIRSTFTPTNVHQARATQPTASARSRTPQAQYAQNGHYYQQPSEAQTVAYSKSQSATSARDNRASVDTTTSQRSNGVPGETYNQTVDPTQVYDPIHDWQREAQRAEAEAKKRAEQEQREATRIAEIERAEAEERARTMSVQAVAAPTSAAAPPSEVPAPPVEEPKKKKGARKSDGTAPKRVRKKVEKAGKSGDAATANGTSTPRQDDSAQAAAMTLMQAANGMAGSGTGTNLEEQMREMFKKMREFNAMNPDMLSKLWNEEREQHLAATKTPEPTAAPPPKPATAVKANAKAPRKSKDGTTAQTRKARASETSAATPAVETSTATTTAPSTSSQAAVQPAPQAASQSPSRGTIWPADKRATLSATAADLLTSSNPGKTISSAQISSMLDKNPSYVELCEQLQGLGFQVDRSKFAKALLSAVPDIKKPQTTNNSTTPAQVSGAPSATMQANSNSLQAAEARLMSGESMIGTPKSTGKGGRPRKDGTPAQPRVDGARKRASKTSILNAPSLEESPLPSLDNRSLEGLEAVKHFVDGTWQPVSESPAPAKPTKATKASTKQKPTTPALPVTKEGMARKRTFADLVDLTALSSEDEDLEIMPEVKRHELDRSPIIDIDDEPNQLPTPPHTVETVPAVPVVRGPRPAGFDLAQVPPPAAPVVPQQTTSQMTQHQILLGASGQFQPHAPRPQYPVASAQPPQPTAMPPPKAIMQTPGLPTGHLAHTTLMVQPLDRYKAIRRSSYNPKTIARDVLLACGRHPDMRHLNSHLEMLKATFKDVTNDADLGTFRWDIADPGGPAPGSGVEIPAPQPIDLYDDADDENDSDNDSVVGDARSRQAARVTVAADGSTHFEGVPRHDLVSRKKTIGSGEQGIRRRGNGRPARTTGPSNLGPGSGTPAFAGGTLSGYAALRQTQLDENGVPVKKKGRPVGWRKWMMKDGGSGYGGTPAKDKQPAKATTKLPSPEPEYQIYKCEWEKCGAELHNLATLRKHLHKLHGKPDASGSYICLWSGCAKPTSITENGRTVARLTHHLPANLDAWKHHSEKKHLDPIAWKLGDGPASGVLEASEAELSEAYLSDAQGRRVTPRVLGPAPASGPSTTGPPRSSAHEKALEVERQATKRKREIGAGIDKAGARLVNDKRRQGFVDDDDTAMVVDDDE
jgi:hypothetical protein